MSTGKPQQKGPNVLGAFMDFIILVLLVGGAGFGGYWYGTTQRIAPVALVPAGTPGAQPATISSSSSTNPGPAGHPVNMHLTPNPSTTTTPASTTTTSTPTPAATTATPDPATNKYWVTSYGTDYIGSSILVKVNGNPLDSFFGPGKTFDFTSKTKSGENTITFEAKPLGAGYQKHKGDASADLVLKVISGPVVTEQYKPSDVITTFKRSATDEAEETESKHFTK